MTGTKVVCSEGDCGACSVILGWLDAEQKLTYRVVDSCIQFIYQLDLCHVISIEGVGSESNLHPVQKAMVDHFGSQCGFCTPGFVMALVDLKEKKATFDSQQVKDKLTGNLCRCTGYDSIVRAALSLSGSKQESVINKYDQNAIASEFKKLAGDNVVLRAEDNFQKKFFVKPSSLESALQFKTKHPGLRPVAGATDVGVQTNKGRANDSEIMFIAHLHQMGKVTKDATSVNAGAVTNWTDVRDVCRDSIPALSGILDIFAAEQIRNAATIGGNIANGSPIADSLPALYVLNAELTLQSAAATRKVIMNDFFLGYKKMDLKPEEMITAIRIPVPAPGSLLRLYKVSKRKDLDISTVTLAIYLEMSGEKIQKATVAAGGVGPVVLRLKKTESLLINQSISESLFAEAGKTARGEVSPITDVRASTEYRLQVIQNLFQKFYVEHSEKSLLPAKGAV